MYKRKAVVICVTAILGLLISCGIASGEGDKARISIGTIASKTNDCSKSEASSVADMLKDALEGSEKFIVVDDESSGDAVVAGAIKGFEPKVKSGGVMGALKDKALGAAGTESKTAKIKWELTLNDVHTGKKLKKMKIEGKSTDWTVDASDSYFSSEIGMAGELKKYSGEPMEDAIKELLSKTIKEIKKEVPSEYFVHSDDELAATPSQTVSQSETTTETAAATIEASAEDMKLYTKYDFVPGDKVIFYDDMSGEEEGEFPYRWDLERGVYEVVRLGKEFWIMATDDGYIIPKMPKGPLPDQYTVELEFYDNGPDVSGNYFYIQWINENSTPIGEFGIVARGDTWLSIQSKTLASKPLAEKLTKGVHVMRIMATKRSVKCYIDEVRVANVPKIEGFNPVGFKLHHRPYRDPNNPTLFRGFRFAEGGKSMREQLDETGKIVTHGILFDSGSHKIKGESYKTLKNIGNLLTDDPTLRLSIEGHTDSDGPDDYNETLSNARAKSVRSYLTKEYGIAADRLEVKGWGESKPIDTNDTAEGKANNRRVELVKL